MKPARKRIVDSAVVETVLKAVAAVSAVNAVIGTNTPLQIWTEGRCSQDAALASLSAASPSRSPPRHADRYSISLKRGTYRRRSQLRARQRQSTRSESFS